MRWLLATVVFVVACGGGDRNDEEVGALRARLQSPDADERYEAVVRLGGLPHSFGRQQALLGVLGGDDHAVRLLAGIALLADGVEHVVLPTAPEARETPNPWPASREALGLAERLAYLDPWFAGALLPGLHAAAVDGDARVRRLALRALERLGESARDQGDLRTSFRGRNR